MARDQIEEEALIALSRMQRATFDARPNGEPERRTPKEKSDGR